MPENKPFRVKHNEKSHDLYKNLRAVGIGSTNSLDKKLRT